MFIKINGLRQIVKVQYLLDTCVGKEARFLQKKYKAIALKNLEIKAIRASISMTPLPPVQAALRTSLALVVTAQEIDRLELKINLLKWVNPWICKTQSMSFGHYPTDPWNRQLPDSLGPKPLSWGATSEALTVTRTLRKRHAIASIQRSPNDHFEANWTSFN